MTQPPGGMPAQGLPDFTAAGSPAGASLPDYAAQAQEPGPLSAPGPRARSRALVIVLSVIGSAVVLLAIVALVLSQTVFKGPEAGPTAAPATGEQRTERGEGEYVPDQNDPDIAPPPPIFTQKPTTDCWIPDWRPGEDSSPGTIRGGDLEYTIPDGWDYPWGSGGLPYMDQTNAQGRNVEGSWYSVVNLGRAVFPESEGGYPGLEQAAVTIFQCYATTSGVVSHFGESPKVTDYRTESMIVDGYPAWIVQATYHFEDPEILETTSASVVTSIVVEGPNGPSALASDVAADQPEHVQGLEEIIASLKVVG
ncbi:hypothetical protein [Brachybacterium phenoliresistens]|uniref:hypothetical protein n=1 Tax=Brachybacterium phenoliresistens TaxID=396014 RepID=UPI0031D45699